jgi:WD40 repeat protein
VLTVNFSPDGKYLASGAGDTTMRLWDLNTQLPKHECKGHKNWVLVVAWSPDAKYVASGDMDGNIWLWNPDTGKPYGQCVGHRKWITSLVGALQEVLMAVGMWACGFNTLASKHGLVQSSRWCCTWDACAVICGMLHAEAMITNFAVSWHQLVLTWQYVNNL